MKKPCNLIKAKNLVQAKPELSNVKIKFIWEYFIFTSIHYKNFTNFFKNEEHYINSMSNLYKKIVPWVEGLTFEEMEKENKHCHIIEKDKNPSQYSLIEKVLEEYFKIYPKLEIKNLFDDEEQSFYQIASQSGVRLIGKRVGNKFLLFFIDCYHLIYPDENFTEDYRNYKHTIEYKENITILKLDDFCFEQEECLECEVLEKITK